MAAAIFELRVLLAPHVGLDGTPAGVAADLAYVLHNQALAILEGKPVDVEAALNSVERLEPAVGEAKLWQFREVVLGNAGSG